ncbi:hypothetical protein PVAP13_1KG445400 [Panicum virgatum]|uniref:Uncharacterized protein n=1 Tax=Panicum virgatum TaxID=38727 RepID=A0A8T0XKP5_PANVG|nr:hypothetical protein PVAP13_1KG445400 [Panicum virgatum]
MFLTLKEESDCIDRDSHTSTIHIHHAHTPHRHPLTLHHTSSRRHRPEFVISDDTCCAAAISITRAAPASESATYGELLALASRCHASNVAAVEHPGVDPMAPVLLAGNPVTCRSEQTATSSAAGAVTVSQPRLDAVPLAVVQFAAGARP